ncbi:MAG: hypothetical protein GY822_24850 [Deltaproteobacteria bacterium]|nr:hypothetical protein [Deltaproteobacteria bacterium]
MNNVVNLHSREQQASTRAGALLGSTPILTLHAKAGDDPARCSVKLRRSGTQGWLGILSDRSQFIDRVRMGVSARFVLVPTAEVATVCGDAKIEVLGRVDDEKLTAALTDDQQTALTALIAEQPFQVNDLVVVAVNPQTIEIEAYDEEPQGGGVPRT